MMEIICVPLKVVATKAFLYITGQKSHAARAKEFRDYCWIFNIQACKLKAILRTLFGEYIKWEQKK